MAFAGRLKRRSYRIRAFPRESQHSRENRNIPEGIATFPRESQHSRGNRNIPEGIATFPRESQHSRAFQIRKYYPTALRNARNSRYDKNLPFSVQVRVL